MQFKVNVSMLARSLAAFIQCKEGYKEVHEERIETMCKELPHGSGIDSGVHFDFTSSKPDKLVFTFGYHHMKDGYYDGWTEHKVIIKPCLQYGFDMRITGRDRDDVKDYLYDVFRETFYFDSKEDIWEYDKQQAVK